jgi:hypothetical protein
MLRESRKSRENPEVLAAQYRVQYDKVLNTVVWLVFLHYNIYVNLTLFHCDIDQISNFVNYVSKLNLDFQLKTRLQELTLGIGAVGLVSSYLSYSPEIAAR